MSWAFEIDNIENYVFYENFLTKDECELLINFTKGKEKEKGKIYNNNYANNIYTGNDVNKLINNETLSLIINYETDWIYKKLTDILVDANNNYFNFNLYGFNELLQITEYKSPNGHFEAHTDRTNKSVIRKLSVVIQLTDDKNYDGGELSLINSIIEPTIMPKSQGTLIIFPSWTLHKVSAIKKGKRNSLVGWVTGSQFK